MTAICLGLNELNSRTVCEMEKTIFSVSVYVYIYIIIIIICENDLFWIVVMTSSQCAFI